MPVSTTHKQYNDMLKKWQVTRAINDNSAQHLIRRVCTDDDNRNNQYVENAVLTNYTSLTRAGLAGLVFRKPALLELPQKLEYLKEDVTGTGIQLEQLAQKIVSEVLLTGRHGLLVEYPLASTGDTLVDNEPSGEKLCRIKPYVAESIINWHSAEYGSRYLLDMVVLQEEVDVVDPKDMFNYKSAVQWRVLLLNGGIYKQMLWKSVDQEPGEVSLVVPTDFGGLPLTEIPFIFIGSNNNDTVVDIPPLYDVAVVNLQHYRNSADYEESIFVCGQPTLFLAMGGSEQEFEAANPQGVAMGSRAGHNIGPEGKPYLLQANPNQLVDQAMIRKEIQIASIGARLIAPSGGRETAEAARIRFGSQNSALYMITHNISSGMQKALRLCAQYMMKYQKAVFDSIKYELNTEFYDETTDPNLLTAMWLGTDRYAITSDEVRAYLRRTGTLDESSKDTKVDMINPSLEASKMNAEAAAKTAEVAKEEAPEVKKEKVVDE